MHRGGLKSRYAIAAAEAAEAKRQRVPLVNDQLSEMEIATLQQLFFEGPVWDGDLISKRGRDELFKRGAVIRFEGWQTLTPAGFTAAVRVGMGRLKEMRRARRAAK